MGIPLVVVALLAAGGPAAASDRPSLPPPAPGVVRVYLVRHGQALSNLVPVPDLPKEELDHLTDAGRRQAVAAGNALAGRVRRVISSPASRARETAAALAAAAAADEPIVDERLRPLQLGRGADGHALTWKEREATLKAGADPSPPGGESMEAVGDRVDALVREIAARPGDGAVALVAHGEVIAAWLGRVRGEPSWRRYPPGLANGAVAVADVARDGRAEVRLESLAP